MIVTERGALRTMYNMKAMNNLFRKYGRQLSHSIQWLLQEIGKRNLHLLESLLQNLALIQQLRPLVCLMEVVNDIC